MQKFEHVLPSEIEKRSFEIITQELGEDQPDPVTAPVVKRVIHASADFDYAKNLCFSEDVIPKSLAALKAGALVITDTRMAWSGINKKVLESLGGEALCFMADEDVALEAKASGTTRAQAAMVKAARLHAQNPERPMIFAVGNAPTALIALDELIRAGKLSPALVIGVPVGFVNVVFAKELILDLPVPSIVARGRKGGSNIAAAIVNALLYMIHR